MEARSQHEGLEKLLKKEDRKGQRNSGSRETKLLQKAPMGKEARGIREDRRGRQRYRDMDGRAGKEIRPSDFTGLLYKTHD